MEDNFEWPGNNMKDKCILNNDKPFCVKCLQEKDYSQLQEDKCDDCFYQEELDFWNENERMNTHE